MEDYVFTCENLGLWNVWPFVRTRILHSGSRRHIDFLCVVCNNENKRQPVVSEGSLYCFVWHGLTLIFIF